MTSNIKKIFRKLIGPLSRSTDKATLFQLKAIQKADSISRGEKVPAPNYPTEAKLLKEIAKDKKIKEEISKRHDTLIENVSKISISSIEPPEPQKTERELPKRPWEYEHDSKQEYEYGFYEPPPEKLEKDRLMFREALEILRARMELEFNAPKKVEDNSKLKESMTAHPAVKRVDEKKLERMWQYFRPFSVKMKQDFAMKYDLEFVQRYIEGADQNFPSLAETLTSKTKTKYGPRFPGMKESQHDEKKSHAEVFEFEHRIKGIKQKEEDRLAEAMQELEEGEKVKRKR